VLDLGSIFFDSRGLALEYVSACRPQRSPGMKRSIPRDPKQYISFNRRNNSVTVVNNMSIMCVLSNRKRRVVGSPGASPYHHVILSG
jgi:hypothetical protein